MAALVAPPSSQLPSRATTPPPTHLTLNTTFATPAPVPNKHIPYCSPGPVPALVPFPSPPESPPSASSATPSSLLHPPNRYRLLCEQPPVRALSALQLSDALSHSAAQPLPAPKHVFPWLHGLNVENQIQLTFFNARHKKARAPPQCLRGITIVKAGGDLSHSRLAGAISPDEILEAAGDDGTLKRTFLAVDPRDGFSVRNFQIQTCKLATLSDIVVYGDDLTPRSEVEKLARVISLAQSYWRERMDVELADPGMFNTFVISESFTEAALICPHLVAIGADSNLTCKVLDFAYQERIEMCQLSRASEIASNVWLGPTPDPNVFSAQAMRLAEQHFDIIIEASDYAALPDALFLERVESFVRDGHSRGGPAKLEFPGSGSIALHSCNADDIDRFVGFLRWVHHMSTSSRGPIEEAEDEDMEDSDSTGYKILFHCTDGYTETSLFALAYCMLVEGIPAHRAWVRLHRDLERNFFAYSTDKAFLEKMQKRLMRESPTVDRKISFARSERIAWMDQMDGSLPSRILPYLYLGNLTHAQNSGLLRELGITRVLSVGEPIRWSDDDKEAWGEENLLFINNVQDNGIDSLTLEFDRALDFIEESKKQNTATLVHCRVGVSRSATICIAEVMREMSLSFPRAYCFVRARRLNVIVQPHLRFCYELLKWEELQQQKRGEPLRRELEWAAIAREIALINKPYCKS